MRQATALELIPTAVPHPLAGQPVLESAPLRQGHKRSALSRFEDDTWDLSPAVFRENARACHVTAHFDGIDDESVERTLREFLYARLNFDVPGHRGRLPPASIRQLFNRARRFLEFVATKMGTCNLASVDQALLDAYRNHLTADPQRRSVQVAHLLEVVVDLHHYREHIPSGGLELLPWKARSAFLVAGARQTSGENKTPRLPEEVIAPLLKWSLRRSESIRRRQRLDRLTAYLDQRRCQGRGVPVLRHECLAMLLKGIEFNPCSEDVRGKYGDVLVPFWTTSHNGTVREDATTGAVTPTVNALLIHLHIGVDAKAEPLAHVLLTRQRQEIIEETIAAIGTETGGMDTPISIDPDTGKPWRHRFDPKTVLLEERMLQAACYIVCAYLTGMRDCEVQAMRTGCLEVKRSEDGIIERFQVRSTVYKRRDVRGQREKWVTIEPVANAIAVLERLTHHVRQRRGGDTLWRVLDHGRSSKEHVSAEIVRQLNAFHDHLNAQFATADAPIIPAGTDGKPWRITTRQFRRTVAWHIANRPFGTVAGMIQYKHASVAAYEGYAGSSRSGFRNEVERERALGQLDDVLSYFERHRAGEVLMGPAGTRICSELQQAIDKLDPLPGHIADPARFRAMLAHVAKTLFVGVLNDCFFDPATALCLNGKTQAATPAMAQCQPDRCPNSCISNQHRPMWLKAIADGDGLLERKGLSPNQRTAIENDIRRYRSAIRAPANHK